MNKPILIPNQEQLVKAEAEVRRDPTKALSILEPLLESGDSSLLDRVQAKLLAARASLYLGHYEAGEDLAKSALDLSRSQGLRRFEGLSQNEIGIYRFVSADFPAALGHYAIAEELLREYGNELDLGKVYLNMGNVYQRTSDEILAIEMYERVADIAVRTGDVLTEAKVSTNMAGMYSNILYDVETAERYSRRAIELYERLGDKVGLGKAYVNLAQQLRVSDRINEAVDYFLKALDLRADHVETTDYFTNYRGLIYATLQLGDVGRSRSLLNTAFSHSYAKAKYPGVEYLSEVEASVLAAEGRYAEALLVLDVVETWIDEHQFEEMRHELLTIRARCLRGLGRLDETISIMETLIEEQHRATKLRAEQRLVQIRAHYDLVQARTTAEVERLRNVELAAALEESTRLQRQNEEYLAFMAHELKSPLTTIRSIANLMKSDKVLTPSDSLLYSTEVFDISTRMFDLISQVLERGREISSPSANKIDVSTVWGHVVGMWRHRVAEKQIQVHTDFIDGPLYVLGSEGVIVSILDNLISNAVKFSNVGSRIDIQLRSIPNNDGSNRLLLSLRDQGPGLTAQDLSRLFIAFGRLSAQPTQGEDSTGLGLLIVKREVEALGGRVWCESVAGQGATFFVELPIDSGSDQVAEVKRTS
ncbi:MAG: ATP-binding protein [Candidatus Kapabacteria bacterium]|nr:ATP-binding protein [Candidatus Kapabacteria bacterium]